MTVSQCLCQISHFWSTLRQSGVFRQIENLPAACPAGQRSNPEKRLSAVCKQHPRRLKIAIIKCYRSGMSLVMPIPVILQAALVAGAVNADATKPVSKDTPQLSAHLSFTGSAWQYNGNSDEIVVWGRTDRRNNQRLDRLDTRFERPTSSAGLFERRLSGSTTMTGGGPKGSVGITLKVGF